MPCWLYRELKVLNEGRSMLRDIIAHSCTPFFPDINKALEATFRVFRDRIHPKNLPCTPFYPKPKYQMSPSLAENKQIKLYINSIEDKDFLKKDIIPLLE